MNNKKTKRALAIVALVFMAIFTVSFVVFLAVPNILNGALGYLCLISFLFGVGFFVIVKYVLKDKEPPDYLPDGIPDDDGNEEETDGESNGDCVGKTSENGQTEKGENSVGTAEVEPQKSESDCGN